MGKEQKPKASRSCFNCLWEPVWHHVGDGFEGMCRCPDGKNVKVVFMEDFLQRTNSKGEQTSKPCGRWASTV